MKYLHTDLKGSFELLNIRRICISADRSAYSTCSYIDLVVKISICIVFSIHHAKHFFKHCSIWKVLCIYIPKVKDKCQIVNSISKNVMEKNLNTIHFSFFIFELFSFLFKVFKLKKRNLFKVLRIIRCFLIFLELFSLFYNSLYLICR